MDGDHRRAEHPPASYGSHLQSGPARRALAHWPRLDRRSLSRCAGDTACIVRLVARRTTMPVEAIRVMLEGLDDLDRELLFG